jgi:hypothetical protein
MKTARGIQDHATRGKLDPLHAVVIFDHELAAVVLIRVGKEESRRKIGPNAMFGSAHLADRVIDVGTETLSARISIEQRWKYLSRKCCGNEQRILFKCGEDDITELDRVRIMLGQLHVIFCTSRLMAGSYIAIDPLRRLEQATAYRNLLGGQHIGNLDQHFLEAESCAHKNYPTGSRDDVAAADPIDVVLIADVVHVNAKIKILCEGN